MLSWSRFAAWIKYAQNKSQRQRSQRPKPCRRRTLMLELLETRDMPATGISAPPVFNGPATPTLNTTPTFSWSAVSGAITYDLWVDDWTTGQGQVIRNQTLATNTFTPAAPLAAHWYEAWVRVTTAAGTSAWSNPYWLSITPPAAPTITSPTGALTGLVPNFTWSASAGASVYDLWVDSLSTGQSQVIRQSQLTTTSFTPAAPLPMGAYQVWVQALNNAGSSSGWSSGAVFVIKGQAAPTFTAPTGTVATSVPTFSWTPTTGATAYDLWVTNLSTGQDQVIRQKSLATNSFTPSVPLPAGSYSAWVQAYAGAVALSPWSAGQAFTVASPTFTAPAALTSLTTPALTWTAIGGATRYDLWVTNNSTGQDQVIRQQTLPTNSFTPTTPLTVGTYTAWVQAYNGAVPLGWSAGWTFGIVAPAAPTITGPPANGSNVMPAFLWTASAGATQYDLWVDNALTGQTQVLRQVVVGATTYTPSTPLQPGKYTAWVRAANIGGVYGSWSAGYTFFINTAPAVTMGGPYTGTMGIAVNFTATATVLDPTNALTYAWTFGDGGASALKSPNHTYAAVGTYLVGLTVTDSQGLSTTVSTTAVINPPPLVVSAGPTVSLNEGSSIQLNGSASGGVGPLSYTWAFGDGGTATGSLTPSHTYLTDGRYTATLTVTDTANQSKSATTTVTVTNIAPTPTIGGPYSGISGSPIAFSGSATDPDPTDTFSYSWNFGDGGVSTQQAPSHIYANAGSYTVRLTVTDSDGGSSSVTATALVSAGAPAFLNINNPPPLPAPTGAIVNVSTVAQLQAAVANLQSGQTIVIAPGTYNLTTSLTIGKNAHVQNVALRGATNIYSDVVLVGNGMDNSSGVGMGVSVWNAQNVTIANLAIGNFYYDDIELKGDQGADRITIYNCHLYDSGEQIIKGDPKPTGGGVTNSTVAYCTIGYTVAPSTVDHGGGTGYTNGVDIHGGSNWMVNNNLFQNFHTPDSAANLWNPAVLFWNHATNNTVQGNTFINCDRAVAFGLNELTTGFDAQGGLIANNFVTMPAGEYSATRRAGADAPIIAWDSPDTTIAFNTVLVNGNMPNSVQVRFVETTGVIVEDNLSDAPVRARDNATYLARENYWTATGSMFVNAAAGDLHLVSNSITAANVIGAAFSPSSVANDYDGQNRGYPSDIGADQFSTSAFAINLGPSQVGDDGSAVQLSASTSGGAGALTYFWSFGDGGTASGTLAPSHVYVTDGTYTATLTVTDSVGHSVSASTTVTVRNVAPAVNIGGPYTGTAGVAVAFNGAGTDPDPTDTLSYLWDFGDSTTSTLKAPNHAFATAGTYSVSLTITDSDGLGSTAIAVVVVAAIGGPTIGSLTATPNPVAAGASVKLAPVGVGGTVTQIFFYLSSVGGSTTHTPSDTLLGTGLAATGWALTVSTSGLAPGAYTVFAQAVDGNGLLSVPVATNLTIQ